MRVKTVLNWSGSLIGWERYFGLNKVTFKTYLCFLFISDKQIVGKKRKIWLLRLMVPEHTNFFLQPYYLFYIIPHIFCHKWCKRGSSRTIKKTSTLVKVMNSGTTGRGNSNLVTEFIAWLRLSSNCHKKCSNRQRLSDVVRNVGLPQRYTLDGDFSVGMLSIGSKPQIDGLTFLNDTHELQCDHKSRNYSDKLVF